MIYMFSNEDLIIIFSISIALVTLFSFEIVILIRKRLRIIQKFIHMSKEDYSKLDKEIKYFGEYD